MNLAPDFQPLFERQKTHFEETVRVSSARERIAKLRRIRDYIFAHQGALREALHRDFRKPAAEVDSTEIYPVITEIRHAVRHLREWMRPRRVSAPLFLLGTRSEIVPEPKGVALIIAPWNFPFTLAAGPLVSAIAAGNCVTLKPSEVSASTSAFLARMLGELFPEEEVAVVEGGAEESQALLRLPFHHVFFTGSTRVGRIVMKAAAENLASVTLELGGKSPAIVDDTAAIGDAADKLAWGKFLNTGQTCVAPDYVLVSRAREKPLLDALKASLRKLYAEDDDAIARSPDLGRIVSDAHYRRLEGLLAQALERGARLHAGGRTNPAERYIAPTILSGVDPECDLMQEEIFGPILPVLTYETPDDALRFVNGKPTPLAMYIFSRSRRNIDRIVARSSAGGTAINETLVHFLHPYLPFGGNNASGIGRSHGYHGFQAFSNERAILRRRTGLTPLKLIYPPYTRRVMRTIKALLRFL